MSSRLGIGFYDYHKAFSAKAASFLLNHQVKVDWSQRDTKLFTTIFVGQRRANCNNFSSLLHATEFCPQAQSANPKTAPTYPKFRPNARVNNKGRPHILFDGKEICNVFNGAGCCFWRLCSFLAHICLNCKQPHSALHCSKATNIHTTMPKVTGTQHVGSKPSQIKNKA